MLYRQKVNSFTLSETLVSLVLMLIIVGLAASVLNIVSRNIKLIKENELGYQELEQLEFVLTLDMSNYQQVKRIDSIFSFRNQMDSIQYRFKNSGIDDKKWIIREQDTVAHIDINYITYKEGVETNKEIDAIKITSNLTDNYIFIYRKNDLQTKMIDNGF